MRWGRLCVALVGGLLGCETAIPLSPGTCSLDRDCSADEQCVSGMCTRRPGEILDSGFGSDADAETKDADPVADAGVPDVGQVLDSGVVPDSGSVADSGQVPDSGVTPDSGSAPDSGQVPDSGVVPDSGSAPDSGQVPDSGVAPDSGVVPDAGAGPVPRGSYNFRRVLITGLPSNRHLVRAAVSRDDQTLLTSGRYNDLFVIDRPTETLRGALALPSAGSGRIQRIEGLLMEPTNSHALVAATVLDSGSIVEGRLYRVDLSGTLAPVQVGASLPGVAPQTVVRDPVGGTIYVVGHRSVGGGYWVTVHTYDAATTTLTQQGQSFTSAGCQDGAVVADGLGGRGVAYVCGINGAEVGVRDSTGVFTRGPNTGNTAHIAGRPQGDYAIGVTWSGGRLARFELGQWTLGFNAPNVGNSAWNVQFSDDGERALVTGQYSNGAGSLREYRHDLFSTAELTDVSIPSFDAAPFLATSGVILEDTAWRPRVDCGYLVGGCDSTSCTRGYLIHFRVLNGRSCP